MASDDTLRLFVAIELPDAIRSTLQATVDELRPALTGPFRWAPPAAMHLTLRFLGDVRTDDVGDITDAIKSAAGDAQSFSLRLKGAGSFPAGRSPSVLWAGLDGDVAALQTLRNAIETALTVAGVAPEKRGFQPHLTLARVRGRLDANTTNRVRDALAGVEFGDGSSFEVRQVSLMRSELLQAGARHTRLASCALASA